MTTFELAPMSRLVKFLTAPLLSLPFVFLAASATGVRLLLLPALSLLVLYGWVWTRMRPSRLVVHADRIEIIWPLKRRVILRSTVDEVRVVDAAALRHLVGWGMRVGVGGLWGAFGWLWTTRRGIVRMYVSRTDGFVWVSCRRSRPWLLTPRDPEGFVRALAMPTAGAVSVAGE